jgi:hypothetical protein
MMMAEPDGLTLAWSGHEPFADVSETHSAVVFFVGDRACKLKKPVGLGFLDFRTPQARTAACRQEVELNRRFAPDVYLGVMEVRDPSLGGGRMSDFVESFVNVAATCSATHALGPGVRSVVWVQGCPLRCPECLAPEWIPDREARLVSPAALAAELLADERVTGLTISGGEPMAQAAALAQMVRAARAVRELTVICFSGYRLARLRGANGPAGAESQGSTSSCPLGPVTRSLRPETSIRRAVVSSRRFIPVASRSAVVRWARSGQCVTSPETW